MIANDMNFETKNVAKIKPDLHLFMIQLIGRAYLVCNVSYRK